MFKQINEYDCVLACIASVVGRSIVGIYSDDFLMKTEEEKGTFGDRVKEAFELAGLVENVHYIKIYLSQNLSMDFRIKQLLWERRALLQVPSLNLQNGKHFIYWTGQKIFDPSHKQSYRWIEHCAPEIIWVFDEKRMPTKD